MNSPEQLALDLKNSIIDVILASPLNIQVIDDQTERILYMNILDIIEQYVIQPSCWERLIAKIKNLFSLSSQ